MSVRSGLLLLLVAAPALAAPQDAPPVAAPASALPAAAPQDAPPVAAPAAAPAAATPPPGAVLVAPPPPAVAPPVAAEPALRLDAPLAGYGNGNFWLRDPNDWFVLFPKGRTQIDAYFFPGRGDAPQADPKCMDMPGAPCARVDENGPKDPRQKDTLFVRRARIELQGTFLKHFDFSIAGEFASTPATGSYGTLTDVFVVVDYFSWAKLQIGQFDAPFTLENRTSDKYFDFMERSTAVRGFGVPLNKDNGAMIWGYPDNRLFYYSLGVFDGDGQSFKALDGQPAIIGRAFVAPLALVAKDRRWLQDLWVGGSIWWKNAKNEGGPGPANATGGTTGDLPSLSTQGGLGFFSSSYGNGKDASGNSVRSHLAANGTTFKWAVEANVPISRFGLRFELVHQSIDLSRYDDTAPMGVLTRTGPLSGGNLSGTGFYVEAYGWILGDVNFLETPGLELMPRLKKYAVAPPKWGLMVAAKIERVDFDVNGITLPSAMKDPAEGHYSVTSGELGVNAWATKHVRLTANYVANYIDGDSANVKKSFYFQKLEHELLFRVGIAL